MSRGRKKGGGAWGGIIALILIIWLLDNFGWVFSSIFALGIVALFVFVIRAIIKATKETQGQTEKKPPVDVRTQGTYPRPNAAPRTVEVDPPRPAPQPVKKEPAYPPEVQAVIDEGQRAHKELERLYAIIPDLAVKAKIRELIDVSDKIVEDAKADPSDVPQIKKFQEYYLPTTIKLLNAYDRMSSQEVSGENITGSMQRIEDMLDTTIDAYKKQLDALFANQAADIQMDIEIMNGMLAREGLGGKSYLDLNEFMRQHEKQQQYAEQENLQKGSTSNG